MNTHKSLLVEIVHRQLSFLGHAIRNDDLDDLVTGFVGDKRARGILRDNFLTCLTMIVDGRQS